MRQTRRAARVDHESVAGFWPLPLVFFVRRLAVVDRVPEAVDLPPDLDVFEP